MPESVSISQWAERWYHVIASHRLSQLSWRAFYLLQRRFFPLLTARSALRVETPPVLRENRGMEDVLEQQLILHSRRGRLSDRVDGLLAGDFCFLNQTRFLGCLGDTPLEKVEPVSHLWRFHFHYQEYLLDLLAADRLGTHPEAARHVWPLISQWIAANPIDRPGAISDAWHPFCLSRRIAVWLLLYRTDAIPESERSEFSREIESQTRYLERHLEWDLRGNHLLENLRTLALAGATWQGPDAERRLDRSTRLLPAQLQEQILPSGEHFERSPMYHAQMLAVLLEIRDATAVPRPQLSQLCSQTAVHMAALLRRVLHPDGLIPLLADSTLEETPEPSLLIERASTEQDSIASERCESRTYWTWRDDDNFLLFDYGPVGADDLPAHAHNDLLTIEASLQGERFIVDSGVFDYADSDMRQFCRSTAAHNVLQIDGQEQCDLWSRFRMGRRGRPTGFVSGSDGEFSWAAATHNAYEKFGAKSVGRWIACRPRGPWIFADWADGQGNHDLDHWLHLADTVRVLNQDGNCVEIRFGGHHARIRYMTPGRLTVDSAWYCPDFGVRRQAPLLRFQHYTALPGIIVWVVEWGSCFGNLVVEPSDRNHTEIIWHDNTGRWTWTPTAAMNASHE